MRQNFVIKKDEQKGKQTAMSILNIMAIIQLIIGFVGAFALDMPSGIFAGFFGACIFWGIELVIYLTMKFEYHGCFSMEGFTIDVKIVDFSRWNGAKWEARVNNVLLPKVSGRGDLIDKFECKINNIHDLEVYCKDSPEIKIDGMVVVEDDVVYVDKIKQALNMY